MMTNIFMSAIALLLVIEGIMPFLSPARWRVMMAHMASLNDRVLRLIGLVSMLLGAVLMYCVHFGLLVR